MITTMPKTTQLGELVAAVFDEAAYYSADPREISRLATRAVAHLVRRSRRAVRVNRRLALHNRGGL